MKRVLLIALSILTLSAQAQLDKTDSVRTNLSMNNTDTVAWVYNGTFNLGINEGFLHNWAAGGEIASATVNGLFSGVLNRLYHRHIWSNNLDMTYSLFYAYSNNFTPRKMDDRIDYTSKYGYQLKEGKDFYLTTLFNFKSQFTKGYDYEADNWDTFSTSKFLAPAYFILAPGIEYRKGTNLSLFISPVAGRMTVASKIYTERAPEGAFGIAYGKTARYELGAYFSGRYVANITENLTYKVRVDLYSNYLAKDYTDSLGNVVKKDSPGNVDVLWDNLFSWKLAKYFSLTLGGTFIYDNDIPYVSTEVDKTTGQVVEKNDLGNQLGWWQIKQVFSIGFLYKF
ncbi:MAG: DUF3078 domain-containing protein [Chitinophagaceae bacterium]|nr:DUF3078 domain-containing protein [Chitinophagaceae bacterium]MCB9046715.1 DUF3078 domain-containing protein [Chitinophagales bacterium]